MAVGFLSAVRVRMRPTCIMEDRASLSASALCLDHGTKLSNGVEDMVISVATQDSIIISKVGS